MKNDITTITNNPSAKINLFCFPHAGGGTLNFRKWKTILPDSINLQLLCYPGREARMREDFIPDIEALIEANYQAIVPFLDKPYIFFGHSYGALAAYLLSKKIESQKKPLAKHLFLSACEAPHCQVNKAKLAHLDLNNFIKEMNRIYKGLSDELLQDNMFLSVFAPIMYQDFKMYESYSYQPETGALNTPITVFGFEEDYLKQADLLEWQKQSTRHIKVNILPGGHFTLLDNFDNLIKMIVSTPF